MPVAAPANDDWNARIGGYSGGLTASNTGATLEDGEQQPSAVECGSDGVVEVDGSGVLTGRLRHKRD